MAALDRATLADALIADALTPYLLHSCPELIQSIGRESFACAQRLYREVSEVCVGDDKARRTLELFEEDPETYSSAFGLVLQRLFAQDESWALTIRHQVIAFTSSVRGDSTIVGSGAIALSNGISAGKMGVAVGGSTGDIYIGAWRPTAPVEGRTESERQHWREQAAYLAEAMRAHANMLRSKAERASKPPRIPYKDLLSYELSDKSIFFGREQATEQFLDRIKGRGKARRLTVLHAPSGSGKTSLINAAITPALLRAGDVTLYVPIRIGTDHENPVAAAIRKRILDAAPADQQPPPKLSEFSLQGFLRLATLGLDREHYLVIFLDQFENFFTHLTPKAQSSFSKDLAACYEDERLLLKFVISIRKDYFSELDGLRDAAPSVFHNQFRLEPMTHAQAAEAIIKPVEPLGIQYTPELVETLLDDLKRGGMELPQLQLICSRLYETLQGNTIALDDYEALGRAEGILGGYLSSFMEQLDRLKPIAQDVLKNMVTSEGDKRVMRRDQLDRYVRGAREDLDKVLTRLVDGHLLQREQEDGVIRYEIAHEYLAKYILETEIRKIIDDILTARSWRIKLTKLLSLLKHWLRQMLEGIPPRVRNSIAYSGLSVFVVMLLVLTATTMLRMRAKWTRVHLPQGDKITDLTHSQNPISQALAATYNSRIGSSLFFSEDGGETWHLLAAGAVPNIITSLSINPFNPSSIWLATDGDGIFTSDDGGKTWKPSSVGLGSFVVNKIEADPNIPGLLYAATDTVGSRGGLYRSLDSGQTWRIVGRNLSSFSISDFSLTRGGVLFAAVSGQGVYRCEMDAETECKRTVEGLTALDIEQVRFSPKDEVVYVGSTSSGLFKSADLGESWQKLTTPQQHIEYVAVDAIGKLYIVTVGSGGYLIWSSSDQGDSWQKAGSGWLYSAVYAISTDPNRENRVLIGKPTGVLRSTDGGINWTFHSVGVRPFGVQDMALADTPEGPIYIATTSGTVFRSYDKGSNWELASNGLNVPVVRDLAVDPNDPAIIYAGTYRPNFTRSFFVTWDGGNNWTDVDVGNDDVRMIAIDLNNPLKVYAATYGSGIVRSEDGGLTWSGPLQPMLDPWTQAVAIAPQSSDILVAGTSTGVLYRSDDGGQNWQVIATQLPPIQAIVISRQRDNLVYVGTRHGIWIIKNQSGSWSSISSLADADINALVADPCNSTGLFAGTDEGNLFWSANGGRGWAVVNSDLVIGNVSALATYTECTRNLFLGTYSEGLLSLDYRRLWDHIWPIYSQR